MTTEELSVLRAQIAHLKGAIAGILPVKYCVGRDRILAPHAVSRWGVLRIQESQYQAMRGLAEFMRKGLLEMEDAARAAVEEGAYGSEPA